MSCAKTVDRSQHLYVVWCTSGKEVPFVGRDETAPYYGVKSPPPKKKFHVGA